MAENVRRLGGVAVIVEDPWGAPVDPAKVEEAFAANPDAALFAFVHAETSTGALSDAATLAAIARRHGALTIMDCVTSSAVCRSCSTSGASMRPIRAARNACRAPRPVAGEFFGGRGGAHQGPARPCPSWFQDLGLVLGYWSGAKRTYHHTAPVNPLYGLHESLVMLAEEGLEAAWRATTTTCACAPAWRRWASFVVSEDARLPQLNTVWVPEGVDEAAAAAVCSGIRPRDRCRPGAWPARCGGSA
jgi:alanine-glyoxylate transaminase/serine-glyoxylate transaminase/serine-pyruvate transaminase